MEGITRNVGNTELPSEHLPDPEPINLSPTEGTEASGPTMQQFWEEAPNLDTEVEMILNSPGLLKDDQLADLHTILSHYLPEDNGYGADFDFKQEISAQLNAIRAMRQKIMNVNGTIKDGTTIREVKECLAAANTLTTALMKNHEKIMNFDRQRALEQATIAAVDKLPEEAKAIFFEELNNRLEQLD